MNKKHVLILIVALLMINWLCAQKAKSSELVSMHPSTHINEAVMILEQFTLQELGKKMINLSSYNSSINVPINNLRWEVALELILLQNNLIREDAIGYVAIKNIPVPESKEVPIDAKILEAQTKQIKIKAIALLADRSYLKTLGIDWSTVLNGKVNVNAGFAGASQLSSPLTLTGSGTTNIGNYSMDISTLIRTIENNQKGNILAEPSILVSSGKEGYIQVGQDISIKTADEAGNTKDSFFSTGIIMTVEPELVEVDGEELILMKLSIQRSSGAPSAISTVVSVSKSTTELVLYDKEEAVIAGLFDTDETKIRSGIPILKDLPWWVFGIRYLTGYDSYEKKDRELVITIKAEIMDTALERLKRARMQDQSEGKR